MAKRLPTTISHKEFLKILKAVRYADAYKTKQMKSAFMLGFYQAMRVSEVVGVRSKDVDKERGFIHILQAKGKKDRDTPIMPPTKNALKNIPINYSVRTLQREFKYWAKEVLDRDLHFHILRHSGASFYLNELKVDMRHVQQLLGHSRITTTEIYTHVSPSNLKKVMEEAWDKL